MAGCKLQTRGQLLLEPGSASEMLERSQAEVQVEWQEPSPSLLPSQGLFHALSEPSQIPSVNGET